jgi:hypothetical protein
VKNYRVTFGGEKIDYYCDFPLVRNYRPIIKEILEMLKRCGVDQAWWFFEPYVEITWLCDDDKVAEVAMECVTTILKSHKLDFKQFNPTDGVFGDWYGLTLEERQFGAERYAEIAKTSSYYLDNMEVIQNGLGLEKHFMRATHVLANQLGMNYEEEGIALLKRGCLALLFYNLGHEKAVATYEKLFKEKYLGRDEDPSKL